MLEYPLFSPITEKFGSTGIFVGFLGISREFFSKIQTNNIIWMNLIIPFLPLGDITSYGGVTTDDMSAMKS